MNLRVMAPTNTDRAALVETPGGIPRRVFIRLTIIGVGTLVVGRPAITHESVEQPQDSTAVRGAIDILLNKDNLSPDKVARVTAAKILTKERPMTTEILAALVKGLRDKEADVQKACWDSLTTYAAETEGTKRAVIATLDQAVRDAGLRSGEAVRILIELDATRAVSLLTALDKEVGDLTFFIEGVRQIRLSKADKDAAAKAFAYLRDQSRIDIQRAFIEDPLRDILFANTFAAVLLVLQDKLSLFPQPDQFQKELRKILEKAEVVDQLKIGGMNTAFQVETRHIRNVRTRGAILGTMAHEIRHKVTFSHLSEQQYLDGPHVRAIHEFIADLGRLAFLQSLGRPMDEEVENLFTKPNCSECAKLGEGNYQKIEEAHDLVRGSLKLFWEEVKSYRRYGRERTSNYTVDWVKFHGVARNAELELGNAANRNFHLFFIGTLVKYLTSVHPQGSGLWTSVDGLDKYVSARVADIEDSYVTDVERKKPHVPIFALIKAICEKLLPVVLIALGLGILV